MDDRAMSDCNAFANRRRYSIVDMHHASILHVGIVADRDRVAVPANHRCWPHRHTRTQRDVTRDIRERVNESSRVDRGHAWLAE